MAKKHKQKKPQTIINASLQEKLPAERGFDSKAATFFTKLPVLLLFIVLACTAVYYRTLSYDITYHDDDILLTNNLPVLKNISNIPRVITSDALFTHKKIPLYRPLQNVTFVLDAQLGTNVVFSCHLVNLLLHILCCFSVFYLLILFGFKRYYAFFGAMIYSVHFLFLHTVIWIPSRGDLLLSLFSFLAMITFLQLLRTNKWYYYVLNSGSFMFALFSKETAVMLPVLYIIYLFLFSRKNMFRRGNWILAACYLGIAVLYFYLREISIDSGTSHVKLSHFLINLQTIPETLLKIVAPVNFGVMPSYNTMAALLGMLVIAGIIILFIIKKSWYNSLILFSLLWYILFLIPVMFYRPAYADYYYDYLDHRNYLPSLGIIMILLSILQRIGNTQERFFPTLKIMVFSVLILCYLVFMNFRLHGMYKDAISYSKSSIINNPGNAMGFYILGNQMNLAHKTDSALVAYNSAIKCYSGFVEARYNRAVIYYKNKKYKEALADLDFIAGFKPDYSKTYTIRGSTKHFLHDYQGAEQDYLKALQFDPGNTQIKQQLGILARNETKKLNEDGLTLAKSGAYHEAQTLFEKALAKDPTFYEALVNIGNCKFALGDRKGACADWKRAAQNGAPGSKEMLFQYCK